jgi:hypothetical protein
MVPPVADRGTTASASSTPVDDLIERRHALDGGLAQSDKVSFATARTATRV